jgi:hypothetical protein
MNQNDNLEKRVEQLESDMEQVKGERADFRERARSALGHLIELFFPDFREWRKQKREQKRGGGEGE